MKILKLFFTILLTIFSIQSFSQKHPNNKSRIILSMGATELMGDLGGGKKDGKHFLGFQDINILSTRYAYRLGYEYKFISNLSVLSGFSFAKLMASDSLSKNIFRNNRNINIQTKVFEFSTQIRYYFVKEKHMPRYTHGNIGFYNRFSAYTFLGGGVIYFKPQAFDNGEWTNLRELNTEGLESTYKKYTFIVPLGLGCKFYLDREFAIGMELINNYTFTDYLDDVSLRGNTQFKDAYLYLMLNITYHFWK